LPNAISRDPSLILKVATLSSGFLRCAKKIAPTCSSATPGGIISPYATGPGPIYYGSGYVSRKDFWILGLVFGAIYLGVLLVIGVPYLRFYLG
jgi:Sodium:sulfate symporter transmembrane region